MTTNLKKSISNDPYLKVNNLCDIDDCNYAINTTKELISQYGNSIFLCKMLARFHKKMESFS